MEFIPLKFPFFLHGGCPGFLALWPKLFIPATAYSPRYVTCHHITGCIFMPFSHQCAIVQNRCLQLLCLIIHHTKTKVMKKGKYIDYNILLACLSKKPKANQQQYQSQAAVVLNVNLATLRVA